MSFEFDLPSHHKSIIKVIGVGGGGGNAVNYMKSIGIRNVEFIICNTDIQALHSSSVKNQIQIGMELTKGLGAGANPTKGRDAALESSHEIREVLRNDGTKMLFITAGMGGGTGTGAAPVIAQIARELDILTVGIVTLPFEFEGKSKLSKALEGIEELKKGCDSVITILNQRLIEIYGDLSQSKAFEKADDIIATSAKCIAEIVTVPGQINVDFEDVKTVMKDAGSSVLGSAEVSGQNRAEIAINDALSSPLLNNTNINGAKKILLNIVSGGGDNELSTLELNTITKLANKSASENVEIIFGTAIDGDIGDSVRVTIIATGFQNNTELNHDIINNDDIKESQIDLFEKKDIEFIQDINDDEHEEIIHNIEDEYEECDDSFDSEEKEFIINDRSEDVIIEELDGYDENEIDHSSKKNDYLSKRKERISNHKNNIYQEDPLQQKLAIPAFKRKNINLDDEDSLSIENSKTIDFSEED
ncbi:MAG: cell division protein FtsZ [Cytophagales bacterium]|nr:MAG: cell division protein FtsZ [Rhodothermaeota bacterium MED-G18]|tara:strand:- start:2592 stop:4016 length:1425 start_codon:yes stop_codon:yes gene_type:complete